MRMTQRLDLLTTIRGSIVSFFAITMFVALGVGLFLGIHWIAGAMNSMARSQFDAGNAHDVEITFPYGLTDEDVAALASLEEGLDVEAGWLAFEQTSVNNRNLVMRVGTLPERIDTFTEVTGTLPTKTDELALEATMATKYGYAIGDTVSFLPDGAGEGSMRYLTVSTFTVTALVTSPAFLAGSTATYGMSTIGSGSVDALAWAMPEAFNKTSYLNGRPYVLLRSERLASMDPFGSEYRAAVADLEARVMEVGEPAGAKRLDLVHALVDIVSSDRVNELVGLSEYLEQTVAFFEGNQISVEDYNAALDEIGQRLSALLADWGIDVGVLDHTSMEPIAALVAPVIGLVGDEAFGMFHQLRASVDSLADYSWIVLTRTYNGAVVLMDGYTGVTANLRWSMASLFLVVGILVCYSAVSRLVHEQLTRIGTKKAVGFHEGEIRALFMYYAVLCVALGVVLGVGIAVLIVERILIGAMGNRFVVEVVPHFNGVDVALMAALELVLILGATWLAVHGVLRMSAVELLAGEKPPTARARFYERWGIWQRLGLLAQTTINNCVNDTRRVVGTLVGVAGCTALIACAVTLNDNVLRSFDRQYSRVMGYDAVASVNPGTRAAEEGTARLASLGMEAAPVFQRSLTLRQPDGAISIATVTVPVDVEAYLKVMHLNPVGSKERIDVAGNAGGVWVSEAYHEHLGAKAGDLVTLVDTAGNKSELPIAGFFEWHLLSHQIVISQELYEREFGTNAQANRLFVNTGDQEPEVVVRALRPLAGYVSTRNDFAANQRGFTEFSSIARIVVVVYLALAAVMAACVLLNLDFMFVDEKKRELIVLMINGYSLKDAKGYIWHDSVVLTALGIACGLLLGGVVGSLTIRSIEQANSSFLHGASPIAMVAAIVGTAILSASALLVALRRISRFDLTDINRF